MQFAEGCEGHGGKIRQILEGTDPNRAVAVSTMELTAYRNVIQAMAEFIEEIEVG